MPLNDTEINELEILGSKESLSEDEMMRLEVLDKKAQESPEPITTQPPVNPEDVVVFGGEFMHKPTFQDVVAGRAKPEDVVGQPQQDQPLHVPDGNFTNKFMDTFGVTTSTDMKPSSEKQIKTLAASVPKALDAFGVPIGTGLVGVVKGGYENLLKGKPAPTPEEAVKIGEDVYKEHGVDPLWSELGAVLLQGPFGGVGGVLKIPGAIKQAWRGWSNERKLQALAKIDSKAAEVLKQPQYSELLAKSNIDDLYHTAVTEAKDVVQKQAQAAEGIQTAGKAKAEGIELGLRRDIDRTTAEIDLRQKSIDKDIEELGRSAPQKAVEILSNAKSKLQKNRDVIGKAREDYIKHSIDMQHQASDAKDILNSARSQIAGEFSKINVPDSQKALLSAELDKITELIPSASYMTKADLALSLGTLRSNMYEGFKKTVPPSSRSALRQRIGAIFSQAYKKVDEKAGSKLAEFDHQFTNTYDAEDAVDFFGKKDKGIYGDHIRSGIEFTPTSVQSKTPKKSAEFIEFIRQKGGVSAEEATELVNSINSVRSPKDLDDLQRLMPPALQTKIAELKTQNLTLDQLKDRLLNIPSEVYTPEQRRMVTAAKEVAQSSAERKQQPGFITGGKAAEEAQDVYAHQDLINKLPELASTNPKVAEMMRTLRISDVDVYNVLQKAHGEGIDSLTKLERVWLGRWIRRATNLPIIGPMIAKKVIKSPHHQQIFDLAKSLQIDANSIPIDKLKIITSLAARVGANDSRVKKLIEQYGTKEESK